MLGKINDKFRNYKNYSKIRQPQSRTQPYVERRRNFRKKILTEIQNDPTKPVKMIYDEQVKLNSEIENPPEYHKISSGLLKERNRILPKIPRILQNVKKDGMWSKTSDNQDFVLDQDVGLVIFCSLKNLQILQKSQKFWVTELSRLHQNLFIKFIQYSV